MRSRRWPSPAEFLEAMPKREACTVTALPVGSAERERREAKGAQALADIAKRLFGDAP
jgi:hypothetical protein